MKYGNMITMNIQIAKILNNTMFTTKLIVNLNKKNIKIQFNYFRRKIVVTMARKVHVRCLLVHYKYLRGKVKFYTVMKMHFQKPHRHHF